MTVTVHEKRDSRETTISEDASVDLKYVIRGRAAAIRRALARSRMNPEDIHYITAHGTGTVLNDKVETLAMKQALGRQAYRIPVFSIKSMLGQATTACGAIELAVNLISLQAGVIPPTLNQKRRQAQMGPKTS